MGHAEIGTLVACGGLREGGQDEGWRAADERVIAVKEEPLLLEFFHLHVSDGYQTH